jgi:ABC-type lipoprotein release transport system permease subunit
MTAFGPFLALRYLVTRRINLLGIAGVMFAVWAMLVVDGVFTGFVSEIRTDVRRSTADLIVTDLPHDTGYERLRAAIDADDAVAASAPRLRHHGLFQALRQPGGLQRAQASNQVEFDPMEGGFALLLGVDPELEDRVSGLAAWVERAPTVLRAHGVEREPSTVLHEPEPARRARLLLPDVVEWNARRRAGLPHDDDPRRHTSDWPGLLVGWRRFGQTHWLRPGDPLDLVCAAFLRGAEAESRVAPRHTRLAFAGYFATGHRMFDEGTALLPIETLRTLLGHDLVDPDSIDVVTDIAIRVRDGVRGAALAAAKQRLQAAVQALLPPGSAPCVIADWEEQNSVFLGAVAHEQGMMKFVLFVVMLVAAFVIYATLHMMVVQKVKDIGVLAALGGTPRAIGGVFLLCGTVVGGLGALLGTGLGALSVHWLNPFNDWLYATFGAELFPRALFDLQGIPVRLEPSWVVQVAIGALCLSLLVAFVPARKAAHLNPVTALGYE